MNGFPLRCKKSCSPVNRILSPFAGASIIYLAPTSLSGSSCLPLSALAIPASNQEGLRPTEIYLAFQLARFTPTIHCFMTACALTARFHPYLDTCAGTVCFLWHYSVFPFGKPTR